MSWKFLSKEKRKWSEALCNLFSLIPGFGLCLFILVLVNSSWTVLHHSSVAPLARRSQARIPSHVQTSRANPANIHKPLAAEDPRLFLRQLGLRDVPDSADRNVTWVQILTYPEAGLPPSMLGRVFADLPKVFFLPEPLVMVYSALYGSDANRMDNAVAYNVLYDNTAHGRKLSKGEAMVGLGLLSRIYTCSMSGLPTPILIHPYWERLSRSLPHNVGVASYAHCLRKKGISTRSPRTSLSRCRNYIAKVCPPTFTTNPKMGYHRMLSCYSVLYRKHRILDSVDDALFDALNHNDPVYKAKPLFHMYFTCLNSYKLKAAGCVRSTLDRVCSRASSRIVTTTRSSVFITRSLLSVHRQYKIVHLVRDPRAVAYNRFTSPKADEQYAYFEEQRKSVLAKTYCDVAARQIGEMRELKRGNRRQVLGVSYDKLLHRLSDNIFYLFRFMNILPSVNETDRLVAYLRSSEARLIRENYKWAVDMGVAEIFNINRLCKLLLNEMTKDEGKATSESYFL
ncbi:hypothetical protein CAPTEDRAFT_224396 [Capitella teleta]|uniref:Sulfotransferase domain-containing protein n=1 Tax=Capitella teleta TaxID=283909 RepID=R7V0K5_CAPTE|nr:hypothetical protein CAPTEDRAFT_224396 [Capitella teleta]|eukprot:ELU09206.1 hypothetical protein CAPTEDRAFT_224396 [Capitella teleta]